MARQCIPLWTKRSQAGSLGQPQGTPLRTERSQTVPPGRSL